MHPATVLMALLSIMTLLFGVMVVFPADGVQIGGIKFQFPTAEEFEIRVSHPGSDRWTPGGRTTKHWVLLPDAVVKNREELRDWVQIAHGSCR